MKRKFKRKAIGILAAVLLLSLGETTAFAACHGRYFVDANGDGVCDNYASGKESGCRQKKYFVDADGDGICDNCGFEQHYGRKASCGTRSGLKKGCRGVCVYQIN